MEQYVERIQGIPKLFWQTLEYTQRKNDREWYWVVGFIAFAIMITAFIFGNWLFGILILIATFTLFLYSSREPELLNIEMSQKGLRINSKLYPWLSIESFWVEEDEHPAKVIFKSNKPLMPFIIIHINTDTVHPEIVHDFLLDHLIEEEHTEPFFQRLMEHIGF